ncbi:MAG: hypothetical protein M1835_000255 [Candelina submexicana]|nr:MAG: hypothetical protein M1835_000255 [Candelina submexicana]
MSDSWFREQIAPDGEVEDGCHPDEAQALQSYLNNKTTPQEAAHAIIQPTLSSKDPFANLNSLWDLLQEALIQLPATHIPRIIILLQAIQDLSFPEKPPTIPTESADPDLERFSWKELPRFGHLWADTHRPDRWRNNLSTALSSNPTPENRQELRATHIRKAHIEALLAVQNVGGIPLLDWGYETIADALERSAAILDFEIPAAREWIAVAGKELFQGAKEGRQSWALRTKRDMGKEDERMNLGRWRFWEERMRECQERSKEGVEDAARWAAEEMRRLRELSEEK